MTSPPSGLPAGFIDPADPRQIAPVLAGVLRELGWPALTDLLARIPGFVLEPGQPRRGFRRATPGRLTAGENVFVLTIPLVCEHVVGGIVLSRTQVAADRVPAMLAQGIADASHRFGGVEDASAALSAMRDLVGPGGSSDPWA